MPTFVIFLAAALGATPLDVKTSVRRAIHERRGAIHRCLEAARAVPVSCKVAVIQFTIGVDGRAVDVTIDDPLDDATKACLRSTFATITIHPIEVPVRVSSPLQVRWAG